MLRVNVELEGQLVFDQTSNTTGKQLVLVRHLDVSILDDDGSLAARFHHDLAILLAQVIELDEIDRQVGIRLRAYKGDQRTR